MATAKSKSTTVALSYRTRNLETILSSCERLIPIHKSSKGQMKIGGLATVEQVQGAFDELEVTYDAKITGFPADDPEKVAFTARCKVGYFVKFDGPKDENLSPSLLRELVLPLFYVASERCRNHIASMGYPVKFPPTRLPMKLAKELTDDQTSESPTPNRKVIVNKPKAKSE